MPGLNVDVLNDPPSVADLKAASVDAVRLVSKPDPNGTGVHPDIEQYLESLKEADIFGLVVITGESRGRLPAANHGWFQYGNEPDGLPPASEVKTPDQYVEEFNIYSETFPQFHWIAAGLCGSTSDPWTFWSSIGPRLSNCTGFAVHPYLKSPSDAVGLVSALQSVTPDKLAFVTEFNTSAADLPDMLVKLYRATAGQYWYAAGDWMNDGQTGNGTGFGLFDHPDKLAAWLQGVALLSKPIPVSTELWVDLSNFQGNLTDRMVADMKASGVVGICSQAITGLDGRTYTRQQLQKAVASGLKPAGYIWNFPTVDVSRRLPMFDGFRLEYLALDVEQAGTTINAVNRDLVLCDRYMGQPTEMYTAKWFFDNQRWRTVTYWSQRNLWNASYDGDGSDPSNGFDPFGGWTKPHMKQFTDAAWFGGVKCDLNVRYTS